MFGTVQCWIAYHAAQASKKERIISHIKVNNHTRLIPEIVLEKMCIIAFRQIACETVLHSQMASKTKGPTNISRLNTHLKIKLIAVMVFRYIKKQDNLPYSVRKSDSFQNRNDQSTKGLAPNQISI